MVMSVMRIRSAFILAAALAAPAAAYTIMAETPQQALLTNCFASGASTYQIVAKAAAPDYRIRIDSAAAHPDLRMQLVDRPEHADFVMVDDASDDEPATCKSARTVTHDGAAGKPDVTVQLSTDAKGADYRLYVRSARFSQQDVAALLAAMWKADQRQHLAAWTAL